MVEYGEIKLFSTANGKTMSWMLNRNSFDKKMWCFSFVGVKKIIKFTTQRNDGRVYITFFFLFFAVNKIHQLFTSKFNSNSIKVQTLIVQTGTMTVFIKYLILLIKIIQSTILNQLKLHSLLNYHLV